MLFTFHIAVALLQVSLDLDRKKTTPHIEDNDDKQHLMHVALQTIKSGH